MMMHVCLKVAFMDKFSSYPGAYMVLNSTYAYTKGVVVTAGVLPLCPHGTVALTAIVFCRL